MWRPVPEFEEQYWISQEGMIVSLKKGRLLKPWRERNGYVRVELYKAGRSRKFYLHSLLLTAFVGPRPYRCDACHLDGDQTNNSRWNLRWDSRIENGCDKIEHGTWPAILKSMNKLTPEDIQRVRKSRAHRSELAKRYGVPETLVRHIRRSGI